MTSEEDAQIAVDAGANAIGFNFYEKSPRFLTPGRAAQIAAAVTGNYLRVGVFVHPSTKQLVAVSKAVPLDVVQIHGDLPARFPADLWVWRAVDPANPPQQEDKKISAYLLDTPSAQFGGTGLTFDWKIAAGFRRKAILAGGLDSANVAEAVHDADPWGVDACSKLEVRPGVKDPEKTKAFVAAALAALLPGVRT